MGAKQSQEMKEALRLIDDHQMTAAEAARRTGVTAGRISQVLKKRRENKETVKCSKN